MKSLCESYEDHLGLISKVLGWENTEEGEGVVPFIRACYSYEKEKGSFSNWLWQNLILHKRQINYTKSKNGVEIVSIESCKEVASNINTAAIVESREWLLKQVNKLSEDAKELVRCVLEIQQPSKRKRTKFPTSNVATKTQVRVQMKHHCREVLNWSWPRYWAAVKEVKQMLRNL